MIYSIKISLLILQMLIGNPDMLLVGLNTTDSESTEESAKKGIEFFEGTWQEAMKKAEEEDKYIFMDCYATWCGPCKLLSRNTFKKEAVGNYFNEKFINIKMDMERGEGPGLRSKYQVTAYPTLLVLDHNGEVVGRIVGYQTAEQLLAFVKRYEK